MDARALHASKKKKTRDGPAKSHGVSSCVVSGGPIVTQFRPGCGPKTSLLFFFASLSIWRRLCDCTPPYSYVCRGCTLMVHSHGQLWNGASSSGSSTLDLRSLFRAGLASLKGHIRDRACYLFPQECFWKVCRGQRTATAIMQSITLSSVRPSRNNADIECPTLANLDCLLTQCDHWRRVCPLSRTTS